MSEFHQFLGSWEVPEGNSEASLLSKCFLSLFLRFLVPQISHPTDFAPIQPELLGFLGSLQDTLGTG